MKGFESVMRARVDSLRKILMGCLLGGAVILPAAASNVLLNPGIEANTGNGAPNSWTVFSDTGNHTINAGAATAHAGNNYYKTWGADFNGGSSNVSGIWQQAAANAGAAYNADGWIRTPSGPVLHPTNRAAWVEVTFRDSGNNVLALYRSAPFTTAVYAANTWFYFPVTNACDLSGVVTGAVTQLVAPPDTAAVRYQLNNFQTNKAEGDIYFDDANLNLNAGTLQALHLATDKNNIFPATTAQATVTADFSDVSNVVVTAEAAYTSANTNVFTVNAAGVVTAVSAGSVALVASYGGKSATNTFTVAAVPAPALQHRYSFNETSGTTVPDSVGGAAWDAFIAGPDAGWNWTGDGQLYLPQGVGTGNGTMTGNFIDLPNYILSGMTNFGPNITFEAWFTWQDPRWNGSGLAQPWFRLFEMGNISTNPGDENLTTGTRSAFISQLRRGDGSNPLSMENKISGGLTWTLNDGQLTTNVQYYVAITYDVTAGVCRIYTNGVFAAGRTNTLSTLDSVYPDYNCWLGRSQFPDNPTFNGLWNEFRMWSGALSPAVIATHAAAGPDALAGPVTGPVLTVTLSGGNVVISWPTSGGGGFTLQAKAAVGTAGGWSPVAPGPTVVGSNYQVTVPASGTARFFRLSNP